MTTIEQVKNKIREFQRRTNFGRTDEDNFAPWWLQQKFKLSDEEATMLCSDGNFDFGIDAFHIQDKPDKTVLSLIQAKYTEDINQIKKGVTDITRFIPSLSKVLKGLQSDNFQENILIKRLRPRVSGIEILDHKPLEIDAYVICLNNLNPELRENKISSNRADLFKTFETEIENPNIAFTLAIKGIESLIENDTVEVRRPSKPFEIHFNGSDEIDMDNSSFLSGFGKLSDLVSLYGQKGNQLFDKNVRLFLYGKKNETKGPAGKIKETLDLINNGKFPAEKFAFLHNGVTIYSTKVNPQRETKTIELTNPSVLNGCQTIKSSFFFYQDAVSKNKLNLEQWNKIPISIRIVATNDKELWREVAEANNRQNSMSAAALRANDEIQIHLENEFKDLKIFYERQEGAFENISRDNREKFEEEYCNSIKEPIYIDTLAQTIVCASELALSYSTRVNEVFESKKLYDKVFSNKNLYNLRFLILAHNIRRVVEYAIRNAIPGNASKIYADFRGVKYRELFTRLVLKVILKNKWADDYIEGYGNIVLSGQGKIAGNLVEELRQIIKSSDSPILQKTSEIYRRYNEYSEKYVWEKQDNQEMYNIITTKLRLNNVDVLEKVANEL
jgi:hypothetical protein